MKNVDIPRENILDNVAIPLATIGSVPPLGRFLLALALMCFPNGLLIGQEDLPSPEINLSGPSSISAPRTEDVPEGCRLPEFPSISEITTDIRARSIEKDSAGELVKEGNLPADCSQYYVEADSEFLLPVYGAPRCFRSLYPPEATQFYHCPLYFQDWRLERLGLTTGCLEPTVSGLYFFSNCLLGPFRMGNTDRPKCVMTPPAF